MFRNLVKDKLQKKRRHHLEEMLYDENKTKRLGKLLQEYQPSVKYKLTFKEK